MNWNDNVSRFPAHMIGDRELDFEESEVAGNTVCVKHQIHRVTDMGICGHFCVISKLGGCYSAAYKRQDRDQGKQHKDIP